MSGFIKDSAVSSFIKMSGRYMLKSIGHLCDQLKRKPGGRISESLVVTQWDRNLRSLSSALLQPCQTMGTFCAAVPVVYQLPLEEVMRCELGHLNFNLCCCVRQYRSQFNAEV